MTKSSMSCKLVDALTKGKGKGKDPKSKDDKGKGKSKNNGAKSQHSKDSSQKRCLCCDRIGHMKGDCQQGGDDLRKATAAGRRFS